MIIIAQNNKIKKIYKQCKDCLTSIKSIFIRFNSITQTESMLSRTESMLSRTESMLSRTV
jgi:hypothetical protein